jgi:hypothetical protein
MLTPFRQYVAFVACVAFVSFGVLSQCDTDQFHITQFIFPKRQLQLLSD